MQLILCRFTICGSSRHQGVSWCYLCHSLLLLLGMLWGYFQVFLCFCDQHVPCCKISKTTGQSSLQFVVQVNYSCSLEAVNWHCTLLERCHYCHVHGVGSTTARVSNMTESAQPHTSVLVLGGLYSSTSTRLISLYPCTLCGVGNTTARVSSMTESAQPHISTSAWRSLFLYVHYTDPIHLYFSY